MNNTPARTWNTRAFVALAMAFSGLGLPVTGYANHLYQFAPMSVSRHAWMTAHNILALQFAVFAIWHAILNRHALAHHLSGWAARARTIHREAVLAGLTVGLLSALFVSHAFHAR